MNNILNGFKSLLDELRSIKGINIIKDEINAGLADSGITDIESIYKVSLDENIRNFYKEVNGVRIEWNLNNIEEYSDTSFIENPSGSIRLLALDKVFGGFDGNQWHDDIWFDWMDEKKKEARKKLKPFDYFYGEDSRCSCFEVNDDKISKTLILNSVDYGLKKLTVDFKSYIDMVFLTRGFFSWQFLVCENKANIYNYNQFKEMFLRLAPKLFPGTDVSKLK